MNYRLADGADKIAAFERGMSNEAVHDLFEGGIDTYVVNENILVQYVLRGPTLIVTHKSRLYAINNPALDEAAVLLFLSQEAQSFGCRFVA